MFRPRSPFTWRHRELSPDTRDVKHRRRSTSIELPMQPLHELGRCGLGERSGSRHSIDFRLHAHMRSCFELEIATLFVAIEFPSQRAFDITRARVVSFDEIAVIGV